MKLFRAPFLFLVIAIVAFAKPLPQNDANRVKKIIELRSGKEQFFIYDKLGRLIEYRDGVLKRVELYDYVSEEHIIKSYISFEGKALFSDTITLNSNGYMDSLTRTAFGDKICRSCEVDYCKYNRDGELGHYTMTAKGDTFLHDTFFYKEHNQISRVCYIEKGVVDRTYHYTYYSQPNFNYGGLELNGFYKPLKVYWPVNKNLLKEVYCITASGDTALYRLCSYKWDNKKRIAGFTAYDQNGKMLDSLRFFY